jgi:hypothetical protein
LMHIVHISSSIYRMHVVILSEFVGLPIVIPIHVLSMLPGLGRTLELLCHA